MGTWDALDNPVCEGLYAAGPAAHTGPHYAYDHGAKVVPGETCPSGTSSISGLDFYDGGTFPAEYDGALFFADYARRCAWAMLPGADGLPDPAQIRTFVTDAAVVDLQVGPGGDLFYVDIGGQTVRRVRAEAGNRAPTARVSATPDRGPVPLTVALDGRASSDPDGTALAYAWDTDLDGFDDGAGAQLTAQLTTSGQHRIRLRVTDPSGLSDIAETTVYAGLPPAAAIATPVAGTTWKVGDPIAVQRLRHRRPTARRCRPRPCAGGSTCTTARARAATSTRSRPGSARRAASTRPTTSTRRGSSCA